MLKKKYYSVLAILGLVIPVVYNSCSANHRKQPDPSFFNSLGAECGDFLGLYTQTIHKFTVKHCSQCHRSGGERSDIPHADPDPAVAFGAFRQVAYSYFSSRATDGHRTPATTELIDDFDFANDLYLQGLIEFEDLKGDLHLHSTWSDGKNSIEEIATAYKKAGYKYIAVTDHSPSLLVANGLSVERIIEKNKEIVELNSDLKDFKVLNGTESDILADGSLDYPDEILAQLDIVVASVHNNFTLSEAAQTERIIKAMKNPHVKILGHPHGRLLGKREGYKIDMEAIMQAAKEYGVAIEINSQPVRLDMYDHNCRRAKELGVKVVINSDAHHYEQMEFLRFGVGVARRGWLEKGDILNTRGVDELLEWWKG